MTGRPLALSARRVGGMVLRYLYLMRSSWPRVVELIYWPTVQMILWGFISKFLATNSWWVAQAAGILISGVLLWDILNRGQLGVSLMLTMSLLRTLISFTGAALLAIPLYHFSIYTLGLPLVVFFFNLIVTGWAVGLMVAGLVLRFGLGAESLAWVAIFALSPISGIYYPIEVLPGWLQTVAFFIPASHVFEGMRALMIEGVFRSDLFVNAVVLNLAYLGLGLLVFLGAFRAARNHGLLINIGE